ncbi:MAG: hypothetical protein HKP58_07455 [Desulfatitalea sp.]|nr:pilus assembly protein PilP [Desulfatitalea sp.]NNK00235.1 hypothetical protein [Desulfatitalea sp.]
MNRQLMVSATCCVFLVLAGVVGCGKEPPVAPPSKTVSQKIAKTPAQQPKQQLELEKTPAVPAADSTAAKGAATGADTGSAAPAAPTEEASEEASDLVAASMEIAGSYDPTGRFDPFRPLFQQEEVEENEPVAKRKKRKPQTPLERVALGQLKLTAVIRAPSGNRALVEDATGKGYVVKKGTYIGLNSGQVVEIEANRVLVEEEIEDVMGQLRINNAELKLQKPAGEF